MLLIIIIGLVLFTTVLIVAGLWLMQQDQASRQPASRPAVPELPLASSPPTPSPGLQWRRPYMVPWALTRKNAGLVIAGGLGLILTLPFVLYWVGGFAARDWSSFSPLGCIFMLPFVVIPLLIVSWQVWMLVKGVRDWQRIKMLEARGQLAPGVMLDRWIRRGRGVAYCVAYYFELPWESAPVVRAEMNAEAYRAYQVGDSVQVRYLPDNPKVCRLEV
jgi:hypothetical protein